MPQNMPPAELTIDPALAHRLLATQFPEMASRPITMLASGWDNVLLRLGDELVLRFPRRLVAARLIEQEQRWLPELAPTLPLPIPVPIHVGRPDADYPWDWSIVEYLPGTTADADDSLDLDAAAGSLGGFLAALHRPAPPTAPVNPVRGVPLQRREDSFGSNLELVAAAVDRERVEQVWQSALGADPWQHPPVWVHGDLHPANLLVRDGQLAAVLDFGDLTAGDPATDLAIAWMLLLAEQRQQFWTAYFVGDPDEALMRRARGWALALGVVFLAHSADNPGMHRIGQRTVSAVLTDD